MRRRMMLEQGGGLPSAYQQVEWILSDGHSYINTQYIPQQSIKAMVQFNISTISKVSDKMFFGATTSSNTRIYLEIYRYNYGSSWNGSIYGANGLYAFSPASISSEIYTNPNTITMESKLTLNSRDYSPTSSLAHIPTIPLFLFAWNSNGTAQYYNDFYQTIGITFWENGIKTREYITCYRKSDGVIGMYDLCGSICPLTNTPFYINAGTGTFTKGADVL